MNTVTVPSSTQAYQLLTDHVLENFDFGVSECSLVLMVEDAMVPENKLVSDLKFTNRRVLLVTRAMIDAEVVWRQRSGETSFYVNLSNGFTFGKLKAGIAQKTGLSVDHQHVRFDGDLENRRKQGLENPSKDTEISKHFRKLSPVHLRFILEEVTPIVVKIGAEVDVVRSEMRVSPKLTSQRLTQNLSIMDGIPVSYKTHQLIWGGTHLMLSSPYGFVCTDPRPDSTLGAYGVKEGDFLLFKKRDPSHFFIVKMVSGGQFQLEGYNTDDYVADIMWEVAERKHWEWPDPMRLIFAPHNLEHLHQLKEYDGITQDSVIHMVPRMRRA